MINKINYLFFVISFFALACENKNELGRPLGECSYELRLQNSKMDTFNLTYDGQKQGKWVVYKDIIPKSSILPSDNSKALQGKIVRRTFEEGLYKDNKKTGYWKYYNEEDGSLKDSVLYSEGEIIK